MMLLWLVLVAAILAVAFVVFRWWR